MRVRTKSVLPPVTVSLASGGKWLGDQGEGFAESADGLRGGGGGGIDGEVEAEVGLAGDADLAADQPVDLGVEVDGAGLEGLAAVSWTGKATSSS